MPCSEPCSFSRHALSAEGLLGPLGMLSDLSGCVAQVRSRDPPVSCHHELECPEAE